MNGVDAAARGENGDAAQNAYTASPVISQKTLSRIKNLKKDRKKTDQQQTAKRPVLPVIDEVSNSQNLPPKPKQQNLPDVQLPQELPIPQNLLPPPAAKRRASIIIDRRPPVKRQTDKLSKGELVSVNGQQYKIEKEIGSGGSCVVYKASVLGTDTEEHVALKVVDLSNADSELTKVFENEIRCLEKLQNNSYVIKMHDYQRVNDKLYVVLELGEFNFKEFLKNAEKNHRTDSGTIRYYWSEMLKCVNVIHQMKIVHADLKPANFVFVKGMIKLIDFGIAAQIMADENAVYRKTLQGTLNYISPEAITCPPDGEGFEILLKSDVWSLGCILYALAYGAPPFASIEKQEKKLLAIRHDPVPFPRKLKNPALEDVLKLCLSRDLNVRPTVQQLMKHPYVLRS